MVQFDQSGVAVNQKSTESVHHPPHSVISWMDFSSLTSTMVLSSSCDAHMTIIVSSLHRRNTPSALPCSNATPGEIKTRRIWQQCEGRILSRAYCSVAINTLLLPMMNVRGSSLHHLQPSKSCGRFDDVPYLHSPQQGDSWAEIA